MINKTLGIDYDDVISGNVKAWSEIIKLFYQFGATIYIVTYRDSSQFDDMDLKIPFVKDYIFTSANAKKKYCKDSGIDIDIWIDDCPESIIFDYQELLKNMN